MATKRKVEFGANMVHYAIITETTGTNGAIEVKYAAPVRYPGAMKLEFDPVGNETAEYADNGYWWGETSNVGFKGKMTMAVADADFEKAVFGQTKDTTSGLTVENKNDVQKRVALLFQVESDQGPRKIVYYNVSISRPKFVTETTDDKGKKINKPEYEFVAMPSADKGDTKAYAETGDAAFESFFTAVKVKGAE